MDDIIVGLRGLNTVSSAKNIDMLLAKLEDSHSSQAGDQAIMIDLSSHYKPSLSIKIDLFRQAIRSQTIVTFDYYGPKGKSKRKTEPYKIIFKWSEWYLLAFCLERSAFRLFKLNRLWNASLSVETYKERFIPQEKLDPGNHLSDTITFEAVFDKSVEYLLVESYGPDSYYLKNDKLHFTAFYTNIDFISQWLLSFGNKVRVLSPPQLIDYINTNAYKKE